MHSLGQHNALMAETSFVLGFPHSSVDKESICNAGDPSLIPGLGRSTGEGIGYPLQYSWASLVAQLGKNLLKHPLFTDLAATFSLTTVTQVLDVNAPYCVKYL